MKTQVVIQTAFIGDVFLSAVFFSHLRKFSPQSHIVLVAKKGVAQFFKEVGLVDTVLEVTKNSAQSYSEVVQILNTQHQVENIFCLHKSFRSAWLAFRIKAKLKFGFRKNIWSLFFDKTLIYPSTWPDPLRQLSLLSLAQHELKNTLMTQDWSYLNNKNSSGGFAEIPNDYQMPKVILEKNREEKSIAIFPGSVWATKKWSKESYSDLISNLLQKEFKVYLMGGPEELSLCESLQKKNSACVVLAGKLSLSESIHFLAQVQLVVGNDSSSSHMAALVHTPVISLFGPTVLKFGFRPWNNKSKVIETEGLSCRPCNSHGPQVCPLKKESLHHQCMKKISVNQVLQAILQHFAE